MLTIAMICSAATPAQAAAGDLDPTFGQGGIVFTDFFGRSESRVVVVQPDGAVVVAGKTRIPDPDAPDDQSDFGPARYLPDGTLDPTFGSGGLVNTDFADLSENGNSDDFVYAIALQPDGKIIAVGTMDGAMTYCHLGTRPVAARYNPDGTLDSTFGGDGRVRLDWPGLQGKCLGYTAVRVLPGGEILAAGWVLDTGLLFLARYLPDGRIDRVFGNNGRVATAFRSTPSTTLAGMLVLPTGKIVLAGDSSDEFAMVGYTADGHRDPSFGHAGRVLTPFPGGGVSAYGAVLQPNGRIVVAGSLQRGDEYAIGMAGYDHHGSMDPTFGNGGRRVTRFTGYDVVLGAGVQPDGRIVTTGYTSGIQFELARFESDGSPDTTFGAGGYVTASFAPDTEAFGYAVAVQPDGRIVAVALVGGVGLDDFAVARFLGE
jgi:uncharacterized delta-60 repeat protein